MISERKGAIISWLKRNNDFKRKILSQLEVPVHDERIMIHLQYKTGGGYDVSSGITREMFLLECKYVDELIKMVEEK